MNNVNENLKIFTSIAPIVVNNTTEGTGVGIDVSEYSSVRVVFEFGISGDTLSGSVKYLASLEESSDSTNGVDGTWTAVGAGDIFDSTLSLVDDPAEDPSKQEIGYRCSKKWVRPLVTVTGTHTNGFPASAIVIAGTPRIAG